MESKKTKKSEEILPTYDEEKDSIDDIDDYKILPEEEFESMPIDGIIPEETTEEREDIEGSIPESEEKEPKKNSVIIIRDKKGYAKEVKINGKTFPYASRKDVVNLAKNYKKEWEILNNAIKTKTYKNKKLKKKHKKLAIPAVILAVLAVAGAGHFIAKARKKNMEKQNPDKTEYAIPTDINNLIEKKIFLLEPGVQQDSFWEINRLSKNFNRNFAEEIYPVNDGNKPYLTAKELVALYTLANIKTYTEEGFYKIFGSSAYIEDVYNDVKNIPLETYYKLMRTTRSGIGELFVNSQDKKYYNDFEDLVIKYNTATNDTKKEVAKEIKEYLTMIQNVNEENYASAELILLHGANYAEIIGAITNKEHNEIRNGKLNEINCNITDQLIETRTVVSKLSSEEGTKHFDIIKELIGNPENDATIPDDTSLIDKANISVKARNLNLAYAEGAATEEEKAKITNTINNSNANSFVNNNNQEKKEETVTQKEVQKEVTKEEAVKNYSPEVVEEKEKEAEENATVEDYEKPDGTKENTPIDEANKREEAYGKGMQDGYNATYDTTRDKVAQTGTSPSINDFNLTPEYNGLYSDSYYLGYRDGATTGISMGYNDGIIEYNAKQTIQDENEVIEEIIIEETSNERQAIPETNLTRVRK